jgi:hypothetical protein
VARFGYGHEIHNTARMFATKCDGGPRYARAEVAFMCVECMKRRYRLVTVGGSYTAPCDTTEAERLVAVTRAWSFELARVVAARISA